MRKIILSIIAALSIFTANSQDVYKEQRTSWLQKAEELKPELQKTICRPLYLVSSAQDSNAYQGWVMKKSENMDALYSVSLKEKKVAIADFGEHITGYFSFHLKTTSRTQDAPIRIKFTFAEVPSELNTPFDPYPGELSRAWLQDETVTVLDIDRDITIPRRLSGRYMKIELLGAPRDFDFCLSDMYFTATTSVKGTGELALLNTTPQIIESINKVSLKTLKECMQTVYEDGPKRDQRLWIGDLYLESLANNYSFKQHQLTKRCLYLLAGLAAEDGRLHANVFENPQPHPQYGSHIMDYSLLYNVSLLEYLKATNDFETAVDLWPIVKNQIADAVSYLNDDYIFDQHKKNTFVWLFFDWREGLDPNTAIQGLMIFALNKSYELAKMIGKDNEVKEWPGIAKKMISSAKKNMFESKRGIFVSGEDRQISYMSQIWMILSEVLNQKQAKKAMETVFAMPDAIYPGAPYGYHYLIEATIKSGMYEEAKQRLINYWGGMVKKGADTFWEVYDPNNEYLSPYSFFPVNSYCHAWSCTPVYFINKYPEIFQKE